MPCLFGWHLIDPRQRTIAIAEGELDAMSLHQVGIPALSVNAGAGNHQWIESDWERLERFSDILVFFDCDEAGEKGAREVIQRLGPDRCRRVRFVDGSKDANEFLLKGAEHADFEELIQQAQPLHPAGWKGELVRFFKDAATVAFSNAMCDVPMLAASLKCRCLSPRGSRPKASSSPDTAPA